MQIKAQLPLEALAGRTTHPLIEAYFEFNHLKHLYRQGWLQCGLDPSRCESVAEHSWSTALLAMFIAEAEFPELDLLKVLRIALLHDAGEIYAGDITPRDGVDRDEKKRRELESITRVLARLPNGQAYLELWHEYETAGSPEARFVKQIDRLELVLQAAVYERLGTEELGEFFSDPEQVVRDPRLQEILEAVRRLRKEEA